jgi:hypothetical protein
MLMSLPDTHDRTPGFSDRGGKQDMLSGMVRHQVSVSTFTVTDGLADRLARRMNESPGR